MGFIDHDHLLASVLPIDRPDFDLSAYLSRTAPPRAYDLNEKLEQWRESGIVIFENAVEDEAINRLIDDISFLCAHPKEFVLEVEFRSARLRLQELNFSPLEHTGTKFNCLENISLAARELSLNWFIYDFLTHVFQDTPVALQSLTFWKGSNQPAHTDYPYVRSQTKLSHLAASWISLEDIHPDSGPLAYYPGLHKIGVIQPFDWGDGSVVLELDSERQPAELAPYLLEQIEKAGLKKQIFLPKKGDILIWHGWVIHEGTQTANPNLTRKSYVTHYTSLNAYPESHKFPDALETGRYTLRNGGYIFDHPWVKDERALPSWRYHGQP